MRRSNAHERRRERRTAARDVQARVRPGHRLVMIDLSACGALVEGCRPLRPGSHIELHLESDRWRSLLPALVVRCVVAAIDPQAGVTYRAALDFDEASDALREWLTHRGYGVPGASGSSDDSAGQPLPDGPVSNIALTGDMGK